MNTSQIGRDFISRQEWAPYTKDCGWNPAEQLYFPYKDYKGFWTFGIGHLIVPGDHFADGRTHQQVLDLFSMDLEPREEAVVRHVLVTLEQHEFDALVSFAFNEGGGMLNPHDNPRNPGGNSAIRALNANQRELVPSLLLPYDMTAGVHDPGLRRRRIAEGRMFSTPYPGEREQHPQVTDNLLLGLEKAAAWSRIASSLSSIADEESLKWGRQDLG